MFGWRDVGRVEPGRFADLLVLDADPRTDVSAVDQIHTLVFKGAVVDPQRNGQNELAETRTMGCK